MKERVFPKEYSELHKDEDQRVLQIKADSKVHRVPGDGANADGI